MQARFLLGPAGSGKTFRCLDEIRRTLLDNPEGPPLLLLAPKQATFQLERQLLADGSLCGYTRLQIVSFERLAQFFLTEFSASLPRLLDEEGRVMVLRALLARRQKDLQIFHATARLPGFAQQLSLLLRELQRHQLLDGKLAALASDTDLPPPLKRKLNDFALLLRAYLDWLREHQLQDANCVLDIATAALRHHSRPSTFNPQLRLAGLWLDGFAEMTPQELDFLAALMPLCERATLAFCLDREPIENLSWLSTWSVVSRTFRSCHQRLADLPGVSVSIEMLARNPRKNRFTSSPVLAHLENHWSNPSTPELATGNLQSAISLVACSNPEAEVVLAAREILRHVRNDGRFRDCAVLLRSLEGHHNELRRVFQRYEIPFFLDRREPVAHHPLAELTRFALRTAAFNWEHDDWFGALKTGLVTLDESGVDALENEALARGWYGDIWRKPVQIPNDPVATERSERLRLKIVAPFAALAQQTSASLNGRQLATALRTFWNGLDVESTLESWSTLEGEQKATGTRQSAIHSTVLEQMHAWLENLELAFAADSMPLRDWLPILEAGLANLTVGVIPPALDQVLIGAIDRSRSPELKLALVLGLNESVFPATPAITSLLTESDRAQLENSGVTLGLNKLAQLGHERYYGYIAFTRASERLVITFSRRDANDRELNPSPFINHLQQIFPALELKEDPTPLENWVESEHACELAVPLLRNEIKEPGAAVLAPLFDRLQPLAAYAPDEMLSGTLAARLYGPVLRTSVSRLEQFASCPFQFFVHSGLRAEERKLFEADARERGSFQHEVLRRFHDELRVQDRQWRQLAPAEARELIGRVAARVTDEFREGLFRASPESAFAARSLTVALQDFIETAIGWMNDYGFDPCAVELPFGNEGDPLPAWELDLGNGQSMAFRGKIDRVDLEEHPTGNAARCVVIDYKSGGRRIDPLLLLHGVQIQLPAYLAALRQMNAHEVFGCDQLIPVGAFYVNLRGDYQTAVNRDEVLHNLDEARRRAYRHMGRFSLDALPLLDRRSPEGNSSQFNYALTKTGRPNRRHTDLLEPADFAALLDHVEDLLRDMGRRIFAGEARLDPYRKGGTTACDYCACRAVCRIDPWRHEFRVLKPSSSSSSAGPKPDEGRLSKGYETP